MVTRFIRLRLSIAYTPGSVRKVGIHWRSLWMETRACWANAETEVIRTLSDVLRQGKQQRVTVGKNKALPYVDSQSSHSLVHSAPKSSENVTYGAKPVRSTARMHSSPCVASMRYSKMPETTSRHRRLARRRFQHERTSELMQMSRRTSMGKRAKLPSPTRALDEKGSTMDRSMATCSFGWERMRLMSKSRRWYAVTRRIASCWALANVAGILNFACQHVKMEGHDIVKRTTSARATFLVKRCPRVLPEVRYTVEVLQPTRNRA